ncbi:hypothetical protein A2866_03815 [Candidatus Roizmanbacteria bacterium RIFCSPHIGHO2_01_FULL_39_8]|uniref:Uncharacterized protein n=3 Tax=Candidatus Roizmaniibacteriota TaxID=1752723 RepID=A0A1F7GSL1_9BACT|nr:MAG: hypothetical protein A2866_03815 [Candidatus Roizmanbacteria bacterium RIFCSPHIGHO2_01_FULL_39_8]OGK25433.1 MAG: hypothetical protein A3C28_06545 [Candidatus Roizmanbacteria bacterium RIFCSPHIGHO2_02_FULL_39_9]OGK35668.1 MAG: hypothetical protein A3F60_01155 [Candidatus Roizmanbacteria bacterium RIFCSPHIGHO2_12_FULL_39_8]
MKKEKIQNQTNITINGNSNPVIIPVSTFNKCNSNIAFTTVNDDFSSESSSSGNSGNTFHLLESLKKIAVRTFANGNHKYILIGAGAGMVLILALPFIKDSIPNISAKLDFSNLCILCSQINISP